jgi:hypothetical protein
MYLYKENIFQLCGNNQKKASRIKTCNRIGNCKDDESIFTTNLTLDNGKKLNLHTNDLVWRGYSFNFG